MALSLAICSGVIPLARSIWERSCLRAALTASGVVCWVLHALASFSESKKAYAFFPDI